MKCWWPAEHGSSAALLEEDLSKQHNHTIKADPSDPLTGAGDCEPCTVPLHEAQMPHPSQTRLKSWLAACPVLWVAMFSIMTHCQLTMDKHTTCLLGLKVPSQHHMLLFQVFSKTQCLHLTFNFCKPYVALVDYIA